MVKDEAKRAGIDELLNHDFIRLNRIDERDLVFLNDVFKGIKKWHFANNLILWWIQINWFHLERKKKF